MDGKDAMPISSRSDLRLTYDDFLLFPDDGKRHELIDGEHYVTAAPNLRHQKLLGRLYLALADYLRTHPEVGEVYFAPLDVIFSSWDVVEPDLLFVAADQRHILTEKNVVGAPALVVEILSPSTKSRDRRLKHRLFEKSGVREYWMVDPDRDTMTVDRRGPDGGFTIREDLDAGAVLTTTLLPRWSLALNTLFE